MPSPNLQCRVSHIDCFRAWLEDEDSDMGWLIKQLTDSQPTEAMRKGTAFHKALELAAVGSLEQVQQDGYTFLFDGEFELSAPSFREIRRTKSYGGIEVSGQVDCVAGNLITDYKTSAHFDAERYYRKYQWRLYLDIFKADRFRWHVFEMDEREPMVYRVKALHTLEQMRYPEMERDCREMVHRFRDFCLENSLLPAVPSEEDLERHSLFAEVPAAQPSRIAKPKFPMEMIRRRA